MDPPPSPRRWPRIVVAAAVLAGVVALLLSDVGSLTPASLRALLLSSGLWGPLLFLLAFGALQPFGLSAHVFIVAAALVWSPAWGLLLSWLGTMLASAVAFGFARWMGQQWVQQRLPARLRRWDHALATRGFRTVVAMRLVLFTFGPMQLMLGVSKVRLATYLAGTAVGVLPMIALESYVGAGVIAWLFA